MKPIDGSAPMPDFVVEDTRAVREAIDREVDHSVEKLAARAARVGEEYRRRFGMKAAEGVGQTPSASFEKP